MTPPLLFPIFLLSARLGLYFFACTSMWMGVFLGRLFPEATWTLRERMQIRAVAVLFGIGMLIFTIHVHSSQITQSDAGFLAGSSSPFFIAGFVAVVRSSLIEPRRATQRRRRREDLATGGAHVSPDSY